MPDSTLKWRFVRTRTSEGEKYYWELIAKDGTVKERIPADITLPNKPPASAPDEQQGPTDQV